MFTQFHLIELKKAKSVFHHLGSEVVAPRKGVGPASSIMHKSGTPGTSCVHSSFSVSSLTR